MGYRLVGLTHVHGPMHLRHPTVLRRRRKGTRTYQGMRDGSHRFISGLLSTRHYAECVTWVLRANCASSSLSMRVKGERQRCAKLGQHAYIVSVSEMLLVDDNY